jgi:hypothetical protein
MRIGRVRVKSAPSSDVAHHPFFPCISPPATALPVGNCKTPIMRLPLAGASSQVSFGPGMPLLALRSTDDRVGIQQFRSAENEARFSSRLIVPTETRALFANRKFVQFVQLKKDKSTKDNDLCVLDVAMNQKVGSSSPRARHFLLKVQPGFMGDSSYRRHG